MWRVCKEAGRSWPVICDDDDVVDYMIMEAVALKVAQADEQAREEAKRKELAETRRKELVKEVYG